MDPKLTDGQLRTLQALADGAWHPGSRTGQNGTVVGTIGAALTRLGLVERKGSSRTAKPSNPGYQYRITESGRAALPPQQTADAMRAVIERLMTQHWDMATCGCWFCIAGRAAGCRPRSEYLHDRHPDVTVRGA
jgi:hypothetical protein